MRLGVYLPVFGPVHELYGEVVYGATATATSSTTPTQSVPESGHETRCFPDGRLVELIELKATPTSWPPPPRILSRSGRPHPLIHRFDPPPASAPVSPSEAISQRVSSLPVVETFHSLQEGLHAGRSAFFAWVDAGWLQLVRHQTPWPGSPVPEIEALASGRGGPATRAACGDHRRGTGITTRMASAKPLTRAPARAIWKPVVWTLERSSLTFSPKAQTTTQELLRA